MKNKVIVFSQIFSQKIEKLKNLLAKQGYLDFSFEFFIDLDLFKNACKEAKDTQDHTIAICENKFIDALLEEVRDSEDALSLINEQAVKLEKKTTFNKMLFLPLEVDFEPFLKEFLPEKEVNVCSIFGKSANYIKEKFDDVKFVIFSKTSFLHTVYFEGYKDLSEFGDAVFAREDVSLAKACAKILKEKKLSLKTAEFMTGGALVFKLTQQGPLPKDSIVLLNDHDFEKVGLSQEFLNEKGTVSKQTTFEMAKNLLTESDLSLCVTGFDVDAGRSFVAVGNKEQLHLFSSVFYGSREEIVENLCDFALFRLLCFLKEKY